MDLTKILNRREFLQKSAYFSILYLMGKSIFQNQPKQNSRIILSPFFIGQPEKGLECLVDIYSEYDWYVNKPTLTGKKAQIRMADLYKKLAEKVYETIQEGILPVSISGDCISSIGMLAGLQKAGIYPTVIWLDAHW